MNKHTENGNMLDKVNIAEEVAETIRLRLIERIPSHYVENSRMSVCVDPYTHHFELQLDVLLAGNNLPPTVIKYPLNWKEAAKDRFLKGWMLRAWPVIYKKHMDRHVIAYIETQENTGVIYE